MSNSRDRAPRLEGEGAHVGRRMFLASAAVGLTGAALATAWRRADACERLREGTVALPLSDVSPDNEAMATKFLGWLRTAGVSQDRPVKNMVWNFYDPSTKKGSWLYPMLSGKAILWFGRRGLWDEAAAVGRTLLRWQQTSKTDKLARSYGAFPSKLEKAGEEWKAGDFFYSGDNLVILEALVALHGKTREPEFLNAAIGIGTWLTEVMCKGDKFGVWAEDHGAPMSYVKASGDFANEIHTGPELLWIGALQRLGKATKEDAYCKQAERAFQFMRMGQHVSGAMYERYEPGFPAKKYDAGRWKGFQNNQLVGDNLLRAALGLCRFGEIERARKVHAWLKAQNGAIPAYLDIEKGTSGFPATQKVYFDVTSSALYRSLCQWLGDKKGATEAASFLKAQQHESGGWYWGLVQGALTPVEPQMAPVVGFWATADLSTSVA